MAELETLIEVRFDAFISYSRSDEYFAKELEAKLERYRAPRPLGTDRRRLNIFRDIHDLTGSDLPQSIENAIYGSRFLIVVCSPAAATSKWVNKEIEVFANIHGPERILSVIIAGRPNDEVLPDDPIQDQAFPEALLKIVREPLAADFRTKEKLRTHESRESRKEALFQVKASLFEVEKEELLRRQRARTMRRLIMALVTSIFLVFAFAWIAQIAAVNADLAMRNEKIAEANADTAQINAIEANRQRIIAEANADTAQINAIEANRQRIIAEANADTAQNKCYRSKSATNNSRSQC